MLHGAELIARVKELGEVTKAELVRGCGYASTGKDGRERLNMTAFYEALLEAKGVSLLGENGHSGRKLSYTAKVQGNGNLIIGKAYTGLSGAQVGEVYGIKVSRRQIRLLLQEPKEPVGAETGPAAPIVAATPSAPVAAPVAPTSDAARFSVVATAILTVVHVIVSLSLIILVLLHSGKGGGLSDMFGGGLGASAAGSTVVEKNLDRITVVAGVAFGFTTLALALRVDGSI